MEKEKDVFTQEIEIKALKLYDTQNVTIRDSVISKNTMY